MKQLQYMIGMHNLLLVQRGITLIWKMKAHIMHIMQIETMIVIGIMMMTGIGVQIQITIGTLVQIGILAGLIGTRTGNKIEKSPS